VIRLPVPAGEEVTVGANVSIRIPGESLLRATLLAYGLPLAGLLGGGVAGIVVGAADGVSAVIAAAGLVAGIVVARSRARRHCAYRDAEALLSLDTGRP
jgi:positive regulator of sigma E activity